METCFTFGSLAETKYQTGEREAAERSRAHAEQGYSVIARLLCDPKHAEHMTHYDRRDLMAGLERLRKTLDGLKPAAG